MQFTLLPETRYNFCDIYGKKFRATVIEVYCRTPSPNEHFSHNTEDLNRLILKHYEHADGTRMDGTLSMPYEWIVKAEILNDVLLPSDILLEINA